MSCGERSLPRINEEEIGIRIERRQDETELEYHRRLVYGKLVDKTLTDVDYTEIAEALYGQPYASDVARRMLYGSRRTLEVLDRERESGVEDDAIADEIKSQKYELRKERQRFFDQRRELNKLIASEGRREHLYDSLRESAAALRETVGKIWEHHDAYRSPGSTSDNEAVLVFSDWHYGMICDNVFNRFDTDTCKRRVRAVVDGAVRRIALHDCSKLHVVILGDLFHGAIHTSARVASEEIVCDQIMQVSEILAQAIEELSGCVNQTVVYMTYGNHGRTVQQKNDNIHRDNMERLIPWWLKERFSGRVNITIHDESEDEFVLLNVAGHDICAAHGDLDSVRHSPRLLTALFERQYGVHIERILLGDKHHRESFEELGVTAQICGSLCGVDEYASTKRLFSVPSQLLLVVNRDDGVDAEYNISVEHA